MLEPPQESYYKINFLLNLKFELELQFLINCKICTYINIKFKLLSNFVFIQYVAFGVWNVCIELNPNVELGLEVLEYVKISEPIRF